MKNENLIIFFNFMLKLFNLKNNKKNFKLIGKLKNIILFRYCLKHTLLTHLTISDSIIKNMLENWQKHFKFLFMLKVNLKLANSNNRSSNTSYLQID